MTHTDSNVPDIRSIVIKLASRCNLHCRYCYLYEHADRGFIGRPKFMSEEVFAAMLDFAGQAAAVNRSGRIGLILHGGEPTLMPVEQVRRRIAAARAALGPRLSGISLQTNGTLLTDEWIDLLEAEEIAVSISLDGPAEVHDAARPDHRGRGSWERVTATIRRLQQRGIEPHILTVIQPGADGLHVFQHMLGLGIRSMNFLLPDVSHDEVEKIYGNAGTTPVADYLIPIFDDWFRRNDPSLHVSICWEMIERLLGGPGLSDVFGNPRMKYVVVETDGTVEALDALKVGREGLADTGLNVLRNQVDDLRHQTNLASRAVLTGFPLPAPCQACARATACGGGYLPQRYARANDFANPSVWCRDLLALFGHVEQRIALAEAA